QRHDRVHLRVHALDAREVRCHDLARRNVLAADARRELGGAEIAQLVANRVDWRLTLSRLSNDRNEAADCRRPDDLPERPPAHIARGWYHATRLALGVFEVKLLAAAA